MSLPNFFGAEVAARYDETTAHLPVDPVVDVLAELAGGGAALELGIGTGRIAVPLARRGVRVHGIDLSSEMVAKLREKEGAEEVGITIGDFATARVEATFSLAYLVRNTIMNLTSQEAQVACFTNVVSHLEPGGCFLVEVLVPNARPLEVFDLSDTHVGLDEYDRASQACVSHHFRLVDGDWERRSIPFRAVSPAELDLMAHMAGMRLRSRWEDWDRRPFTSASTTHVSVWECP
jgi:SAM-dependent methyltransferase